MRGNLPLWLFGLAWALSLTTAQARPVHYFTCQNCHRSGISPTSMTANLCLDCHDVSSGSITLNDDSSASATGRFSIGDASNLYGNNPLAVKQTSHNWCAAENNLAAGAATPASPYFSGRMGYSRGFVACSRCHNPHDQKESNPTLMKLPPTVTNPVDGEPYGPEDLCLDCHREWNVTGNHGLETHPLVDDYAAVAAARTGWLKPSPESGGSGSEGDIRLIDGGVTCLSCHGIHHTDSDSTTNDALGASQGNADGRVLRADGPENEEVDASLCQACHTYEKHGKDDGSPIGCLVCHGSHEYDPDGMPNYYMLRKQVTLVTPKRGIEETVSLSYTSYPPPANFNLVCLSCHTMPGGHDTSDPCADCHSHTIGFGHGEGGSGVGCVECHGHDSGTFFDSDMTSPYSAGTVVSQGQGTTQSHSTHTEIDSDDQRGPGIYCADCHDIANFPYFKSGIDGNGDGNFNLSETDVCDSCHSAGGSYDGLDDPVIGAKANWASGVYDGDTLQAGKEKWCATCHDEDPPEISGVSAPNVIGDEEGSYIYGSGWGFYKTGHGLPEGETFPSKGGIETVSGRPVECVDCHDLTTAHIDGLARTFDCGPEGDRYNCDATDYRTGYRLKLVDGEEPMIIPWSTKNPTSADASYFRLCAECHVSGPFTDSSDTHTNFYTWSSTSDGGQGWFNRHSYHLSLFTFLSIWPADYLFAYDIDGNLTTGNSRATCVTCHNVHGSTQMAMIRDGKLTARDPGLEIWYAKEGVAIAAPPTPDNVTLAESDGKIFKWRSTPNICFSCHGSWNPRFEQRCEPVDIVGDDPDLGLEPDCSSFVPPFQTGLTEPPTLEWTGETGYVGDGVEPGSGVGGGIFTFRVKYTDIYDIAPATIQLWVDKDDDGSYENIDGDPADEKIDLVAIDPYDTVYTDGKIYTVDVVLDKAGDNNLSYHFYTVGDWEDGADLPAAPTPDPTVTITNNRPVVSWAGEVYFENDGVHPDTGGLGDDYTFRITYTDADNECPAPIGSGGLQLWLDDDGGGGDYDTYSMTEVDASDDNCRDGKVYSVTRALSEAGSYSYRFYASDGIDDAMTDVGPVSDNTFTVLPAPNTPPQLDWVSESCRSNGVKPALGLATGDFEFKVRYTDLEGSAPSDIKVWVDLNDNDTVDSGEEQTMTWVDDGNENYTDGEIFSYTYTIDDLDAGEHEFIFSASDGTDSALGAPTETDFTRTVTVMSTEHAVGVRQGLGETGPVWYNSIQAAIDPNGSLDYSTTLLVYEGTYNENIVLDRTGLPRDNNLILQSVCGPEMTVIQGRDDDNNDEPDGITVYFNEVYESDPVIDGFTITGGTEGILLFHTHATVKNCIIEGNGRGIRSNNNFGVLTLEDSIIQNNVGAGGGAGIYLYGGYFSDETLHHTISGSVIRNNQSTEGFGGGIQLINSGSDEGLTIKDTTISGNTALQGGGIYLTYSKLDIENSTLSANASSGTGIFDGGGGMYIKESSSVTLTNSNVVDNSTTKYGAGIYLNGANAAGNLYMTNCTVSNNGVTDPDSGNGGGVYNAGSNAFIHNSILWDNRAGTGHEIHNGGGTVTITWSDLQNNSQSLFINNGSITTDANCIEVDPFFVDRANGDYHLKAISPAIDQGTATDAPDEDLDGDARPAGAGYDMGADEYVDPNGYLSTYAFPATAVAVSNTAIDVSMPYTDDDNDNNTYTVEYKLSSSSTWLDWGSNPKGHAVSPYIDTIDGLVGGETYDVRLTYNDADGVFGSTEQLFVVDLMPYVAFTSTAQTSVDGGGSITITTTLDRPSDQDVTVPFSVNASSTATGGGIDYSITPSPLTITAGNTAADIVVTIAADSIPEAEETVVVDMGTPTNAMQGSITTHTVTIQDVVAYWQFDETSGVTAADSVGSNDATVMNGAVWTSSGKSGYALSFDGADDYVEVPDSESLDITEELTIELWFRPAVTYDATLTDYVVLLERQWGVSTDSYLFAINGDGKLHMGSDGGNIQSTRTSWEAGTWYHVVGTYRDVGGTYSGELYVNGVAETLTNNDYDNMAGGSQTIGIGGSDRFDKFNGIIDEVVIYNRAVTPAEVLDRYNSF